MKQFWKLALFCLILLYFLVVVRDTLLILAGIWNFLSVDFIKIVKDCLVHLLGTDLTLKISGILSVIYGHLGWFFIPLRALIGFLVFLYGKMGLNSPAMKVLNVLVPVLIIFVLVLQGKAFKDRYLEQKELFKKLFKPIPFLFSALFNTSAEFFVLAPITNYPPNNNGTPADSFSQIKTTLSLFGGIVTDGGVDAGNCEDGMQEAMFTSDGFDDLTYKFTLGLVYPMNVQWKPQGPPIREGRLP